MTGTACELNDYNENESSKLNDFDLFSLWLFDKIKADRLLHTGFLRRRYIFNAACASIPYIRICHSPAFHQVDN